MMLRRAAFAIPGGHPFADRRLHLRTPPAGRLLAQAPRRTHVQLGASFPDATPGDIPTRRAPPRPRTRPCGDPRRVHLRDARYTGAGASPYPQRRDGPPTRSPSEIGSTKRGAITSTGSNATTLSMSPIVLVPSPNTARALTDTYRCGARDGLSIARPGTDRPVLAGAPVESAADPSVGIQHPRKGHDILLRALAGLTHLDWTAVIAGKVYDEAHGRMLDQLLDELGLRSRVRLAGYVSDAELAELYAGASIFALATRYEGYGLVFDEALVHGLPIVSCRTGAVPDTVPPEAGHLVPPDDAEAFARCTGGPSR